VRLPAAIRETTQGGRRSNLWASIVEESGEVLPPQIGGATMLRRILMFDVNRILTWDVGRALKSDVLIWRIPAVLVRAALGWLIAAVLLGITVPFAERRGWELPEWGPLLVMGVCVTSFVLLGRRRSRHG
jgi:hypothetical protein